MDRRTELRITRDDVLRLAAVRRVVGSDVEAEITEKRDGQEYADIRITFVANGYELIAALTCQNDDDDVDMGEPEVVEALREGCVLVDCFTEIPDCDPDAEEGS